MKVLHNLPLNMNYNLFTLVVSLCLHLTKADVTIYNTLGSAQATPTGSSSSGVYTGPQAFNPVVLEPPPVPSPAPATNFHLPLQDGNFTGLSIRQPGTFVGFSIEFAVADQVSK